MIIQRSEKLIGILCDNQSRAGLISEGIFKFGPILKKLCEITVPQPRIECLPRLSHLQNVKKVNKPHGQYYALKIYLDEYHLYLVCPIDNPCFILMSPLHLVFYIFALLKFSKASRYTAFCYTDLKDTRFFNQV